MHNLEFDAKHIWHPYTGLPSLYPLFEVVKTEHCQITLADGRELIDGMSSWWSAIHGYNHPVLQQAMCKQIQQFSHIMFGGLTHKPAIDLTQKLLEITPTGLTQAFYVDSGSVAVEVAIKMALQYQKAIGAQNKRKILAFKGGYHGDTFATMAVSDAGMNEIFGDSLQPQIFAPRPECKFEDNWQNTYFNKIEQVIFENQKCLAAVIIEPIVQGAGGMNFFHPQYLTEISKTCTKLNILLIVDEIATGFGRTGKLFACEHAGVSPDIMCLGKTITGGMMSFATTLTTQKISNAISQNRPFVFMHGPTFMANPLACTAALTSINLLLSSSWFKNIKQIEAVLNQELSQCLKLNTVKDVRVLGAIGVVEMRESVNMAIIQPAFVNAGVWVRPFGKLVYIMPAFTIKVEDLEFLCRAIYEVLQKYAPQSVNETRPEICVD